MANNAGLQMVVYQGGLSGFMQKNIRQNISSQARERFVVWQINAHNAAMEHVGWEQSMFDGYDVRKATLPVYESRNTLPFRNTLPNRMTVIVDGGSENVSRRSLEYYASLAEYFYELGVLVKRLPVTQRS
jgi:hypothetical protein